MVENRRGAGGGGELLLLAVSERTVARTRDSQIGRHL